MNIHEYQAKEILKSYGVAIQNGFVAENAEEAHEAAEKVKTEFNSDWCVVKAQIHAGGRGKGKIMGSEQRGVQVAKSPENAAEHRRSWQTVIPGSRSLGKRPAIP